MVDRRRFQLFEVGSEPCALWPNHLYDLVQFGARPAYWLWRCRSDLSQSLRVGDGTRLWYGLPCLDLELLLRIHCR